MANLTQNHGKISIESLFLQLFIPSFGTHLGARDEKNLQLGIRKNCSSHITAIGHKPWIYPEIPLFLEQCGANSRQNRDPGRQITGGFGTKFGADILTVYADMGRSAIRLGLKVDPYGFRQPAQARLIVQGYTPPLGGQA